MPNVLFKTTIKNLTLLLLLSCWQLGYEEELEYRVTRGGYTLFLYKNKKNACLLSNSLYNCDREL